MRSHLDAKAMAKSLRQELHNRNIELGHSECLEVVAKQFGFRDWNTMAVEVERTPPKSPEKLLGPIPAGWIYSGTRKELFEAGIEDIEVGFGSVLAFRTKNLDEQPPEGSFGTIMQICRADAYRGKRISFSAEIKADMVAGSATVWMRVDDEKNMAIAFDNLERLTKDGSIKSSTDWTKRKVVLAVPEAGALINFGVYLIGRGKVWARNLEFGLTDELPSFMTRDDVHENPKNLDLKGA